MRYGTAAQRVSPVPEPWCRFSCGLPPDPRDAELGIRFISAAPIAADMYREIEQRYRCRIVTMYGLTEAFPIAYKVGFR